MRNKKMHFDGPIGPMYDPQLIENVLNDIAPLGASGVRSMRISRRGLIKIGGGLVAVTMLPISACPDPQQVEAGIALAILLFQVGKEVYELTQTISGETMLVNEGNVSIRLESLFKLLEAFAGGGEADSYSPDAPWSIPPGDSSFSFGDLNARGIGEHLVQMLLAGSTYETDPFKVE